MEETKIFSLEKHIEKKEKETEGKQKKTKPKNIVYHYINPDELNIKDFELGKSLGEGLYGRVYIARHKKTNFICALKIITKSELPDL